MAGKGREGRGVKEEVLRAMLTIWYQYKGPNSPLNYPLLLSSVQLYNHRLFERVRESHLGKKEGMQKSCK